MTAVFSYLNCRYFGLPTAIGVMVFALLFSLGLIATRFFTPTVANEAGRFLQLIDFNDTLMQGMLCCLLFAGSLHINLNDLLKQRGIIATLAIASVAISMF